jgi:hypothetical protein
MWLRERELSRGVLCQLEDLHRTDKKYMYITEAKSPQRVNIVIEIGIEIGVLFKN